MEKLILRTPSVGSAIKKVMEVNPHLSAAEMIDLIRQSTRTQAQQGVTGEFSKAEIIDEQELLRLARECLRSRH